MVALRDLLLKALDEDIGPGDVTTGSIVSPREVGKAVVIARERLVLSGSRIFSDVFECFGADVDIRLFYRDGEWVEKDATICEYNGPVASILQVERVMLNLVQRLSGIATYTRKIVEEIKDTGCKLLDTRKTTPLWRSLEKEAVRHGGGSNHRFGLFDGVLIKDNHIAVAGSVSEAISRVRQKANHLLKVEIEVSSIEELKEAIDAGADVVLLDNFSIDELKEAVEICRGRVLCEASGGINIQNARKVAETGVDFISCGALTHSAPAVDISLELIDVKVMDVI